MGIWGYGDMVGLIGGYWWISMGMNEFSNHWFGWFFFALQWVTVNDCQYGNPPFCQGPNSSGFLNGGDRWRMFLGHFHRPEVKRQAALEDHLSHLQKGLQLCQEAMGPSGVWDFSVNTSRRYECWDTQVGLHGMKSFWYCWMSWHRLDLAIEESRATTAGEKTLGSYEIMFMGNHAQPLDFEAP